MSTTSWTDQAALIGMIFSLLAGLTIAVYVVSRWFASATTRHKSLLGVAIWGIAFQAIHATEHSIQFGYWLSHPKEKPYVTPWASETAEGLSYWCKTWPGTGQGPARGIELMHLFGNTIFFVAVAALVLLLHERGLRLSQIRVLRWGFWVQGFHVLEHVMLSTSFFTTGTARGVSTMFGLVDPGGAFVVNYRLTWHFVMNILVTVLALIGVRDAAKGGYLRPSAHADDDVERSAVASSGSPP